MLSTRGVQAADSDTVTINGVQYKKVEAELKPAIETPVYQLNAKEEARMKVLGETIATKTLMYERKLKKAARKDEIEQWKKDHPKLALARKFSGYGVFNDHVLLPTSDWWVDHEGLGIGAAAVGSLASMGLLAGGAARK